MNNNTLSPSCNRRKDLLWALVILYAWTTHSRHCILWILFSGYLLWEQTDGAGWPVGESRRPDGDMWHVTCDSWPALWAAVLYRSCVFAVWCNCNGPLHFQASKHLWNSLFIANRSYLITLMCNLECPQNLFNCSPLVCDSSFGIVQALLFIIIWCKDCFWLIRRAPCLALHFTNP